MESLVLCAIIHTLLPICVCVVMLPLAHEAGEQYIDLHAGNQLINDILCYSLVPYRSDLSGVGTCISVPLNCLEIPVNFIYFCLDCV